MVSWSATGWCRPPKGTGGPGLSLAPEGRESVECHPSSGSRATPDGLPFEPPRRPRAARHLGVEAPPYAWLPSGPDRRRHRAARAPCVLRDEEVATTAGSAHPFGPRCPIFDQPSGPGSDGSFGRGRLPANGQSPSLARSLLTAAVARCLQSPSLAWSLPAAAVARLLPAAAVARLLPAAAVARDPALSGRAQRRAWAARGSPAVLADPALSSAPAHARGRAVLPVAGSDDLAGILAHSPGPWPVDRSWAFPSSRAWLLFVRPGRWFLLVPSRRVRQCSGAHRLRSAAGAWLERRLLVWRSAHETSRAFDSWCALDPLVVPRHRPQAPIGATIGALPALLPPSRRRGHRASAGAAWPSMVPVE